MRTAFGKEMVTTGIFLSQSASLTLIYTDIWLGLNADESILFISYSPVEGLRKSFCALCPASVVKSTIFISEPALASND